MNTFSRKALLYGRSCAVLFIALLLLSACATGPESPEGASQVRSKLSSLQNDPELASRAPAEIREAEEAVKLAEVPLRASESDLGSHRVYIADRKVDIAKAKATAKLAEDQRAQLDRDRTDARLEARTREADRARADTAKARRSEAELQRRLDDLEAQPSERGMVVTLGDVLFDSGSSQLRVHADTNLNKLVAFLNEYPDLRLLIEGHTDNVGSAAFNQRLSQQRAESVRQYLSRNGIGSARLSVSGVGLQRPIADNNSAAGRQQNRRVEIVIEDPRQMSFTDGQ